MRSSGTLMVHLDFIRNGGTYLDEEDAPVAVNAASIIPDTTASWGKLGFITVASDQPQTGNAIDIIAPKENGGTLELRKKIFLGPISRIITLTAVDYSEFTIELASMAGPIDDSATSPGALTSYTPFDGDTDPIKGWFRVRWIDENDVLVRREILWGELRLAQALAAGTGGAITPQFTLNIFPNANSKGWLIKRDDA